MRFNALLLCEVTSAHKRNLADGDSKNKPEWKQKVARILVKSIKMAKRKQKESPVQQQSLSSFGSQGTSAAKKSKDGQGTSTKSQSEGCRRGESDAKGRGCLRSDVVGWAVCGWMR